MDQKVAVPQNVTDAHTACVICTAPRTGSSLLGEALKSTGWAGRPMEYFDIHKQNEQTWINEFKIAQDKDYLEKVIAAGTTPNGVFGLKLHWHQVPALSAKFASALGTQSNLPNTALNNLLERRFSTVHYLWLRRRNTVAQGISYYRATQSGIWRVRRAGVSPNSTFALPFDFAEIDRFIRLVENFDRSWNDFFTQKKIKALALTYEDFVADYENTIRAVCKYIGVDSKVVAISPHAYRQQADSLSLEWEHEYRQRKAGSAAVSTQISNPLPLVPESPTEPPPASERASLNIDKASANSESPKSDSTVAVYDIDPRSRFKIVPAPANRSWMDATPNNVAFHSSPLVAANQHGCFILNPCRIKIFWNGGPSADSLQIEYSEKEISRYASSRLGDGIVTFSFSYLFRAPADVSLYVKGPANMPKDGICPLEGLFEADPTKPTITMNWKVTRAHHPIFFEQNEPIAMFFPIFRGRALST